MSYYEKVFGATDLVRMPIQKEMAAHFNAPEEQLENTTTTTMHSSVSVEGNLILCSDSLGREITPNEFV